MCGCVHVCTCVFMWYGIYTHTAGGCCLSSTSRNIHFHILTYYIKPWKCMPPLIQYITFCLILLNLHNNTMQQQRPIKPRNQCSQRTAVKINHGYKTSVANILPCPMGCFLCQPDGINKSWQGNPCWHPACFECSQSRKSHLNIWRQYNHGFF